MTMMDNKLTDMPVRKGPTHLPNAVRHNTSVILFVTVCAADRTVNTFANEIVHGILRESWEAAQSHVVGAYVLMPDHVHLFCAPASLDCENVAKWVQYWKALVTREVRRRALGGSRVCVTAGRADARPSEALREGQASLDRTRNACPSEADRPPIFQRDCWDTQLRRGESYHEKWEYVRNNPVRRGLVSCAEAWPYWGVMHELVW